MKVATPAAADVLCVCVCMYGFWQGEVRICMEVMDISLNDFYKKVHRLHSGFPEDVLSVIAYSVCVEILVLLCRSYYGCFCV